MKQEQLQQFIDKLETDKSFAITVVDTSQEDNPTSMICNATNEDLKRDYTSAKNYFEFIFKQGVKSVKIYGKKKNGHIVRKNGTFQNWKDCLTIEPLEFTFKTSEKSKAQDNVVISNSPAYVPPQLKSHSNALTGAETYRVHDYDRLSHLSAKYEVENELLKKEVAKLERQLFEQDTLGTKSVEKTKAQADMLNSPIAQMLAKVMTYKMMPTTFQPVVQGLNGGISPIKQRFLNADDEFLQDLEPVAMLMEDPVFVADLNVLLEKHKVA